MSIMSCKTCNTDSFFAQLAGVSRQGDESAIIQGMLTHSEHAGVQHQACASLSSLAYNYAGKRSNIEGSGGIEAVGAAMEAHKTSFLVQGEECAALSNLAVNADIHVKLAQAVAAKLL